MAPLKDRQAFKDTVDRAGKRGHEGNEPTDPPWPRAPAVPFEVTEPNTDKTERKLTGGFRAGVAHISDWASGASKRIAFLWAVVGFLFTVVGALMAWWSTHQGFVKATSLTPIVEQLNAINKSIDSNQRNNETSFAGISKDIEWLKREQHVADTQPLKPEKTHR